MPRSKTRVLLLGDESKGEVREVLRDVLPYLEERCEVLGTILDRNEELPHDGAELLFVFGGDGTILSAARRMGERQIPTLGINLGRLGFLAEVKLDAVHEALDLALAGKLTEDSRLLLRCEAPRASTASTLFLNDIVCQRNHDRNLIEIGLDVGRSFVTNYSGDGVIYSTPVGSTAYSLAAGGPILSPTVEACLVTALASHALPVRSLVVHSNQEVRLRMLGDDREPVGHLAIDGQIHVPLLGGDEVRVMPAKQRFRLLHLPGTDFFSILRRKFGWAGAPNYETPGKPGRKS